MDNRTITVRVVEWTSFTGRNIRSEGLHEFGPDGGLQAAVQAAYSSFPTNCLYVSLVVAASSIPLWANGAWVFSEADMYGAIQDGYVVEVHVNGVRPLGPEVPQRYTVSDGPGAPGNDHWGGSGRGEDPKKNMHSLLTTLLMTL